MWSGANIWIITTVCGTSSTVSMLFAIKGFVSKKCRKATHKSKKLLKKQKFKGFFNSIRGEEGGELGAAAWREIGN